MKQTLSTNHAASLLAQDENANWTYSGALALVEYLDELDEGTGTETEFDRVAIRCDFSQYDSLEDWATEYFGGTDAVSAEFDFDSDTDEDERADLIRDFIADRGTLVEFDGGVIVSSF